MKRHIPNALTIGRLVLTLVMFACLGAMAASLRTGHSALPLHWLGMIALVSFVVAAVTDFFDGMLARRWGVVSVAGAILDPIADKILVCGAILGLLGLSFPGVLVPGGIILFREFSVSALREVVAPKGIKLPVTFLAKTKTTLQLIALGAYLVIAAWSAWPGRPDWSHMEGYVKGAEALLWLAALVTAWTGLDYALAARRALKAQP